MKKGMKYKRIIDFELIKVAWPFNCLDALFDNDASNIVSKRGRYILSKGNRYLRAYLADESNFG